MKNIYLYISVHFSRDSSAMSSVRYCADLKKHINIFRLKIHKNKNNNTKHATFAMSSTLCLRGMIQSADTMCMIICTEALPFTGLTRFTGITKLIKNANI